MSETAPIPLAQTLAWMREHGDELRGLIAHEYGDEPEPAPSGDAAIRAHLRFLARALAATAAQELAERVMGFDEELPEWFDDNRDLYDAHIATGAGAIALEEHLQYGVTPGNDPSLDAGLERRVRIGGWVRIFLMGLEMRLGPSADGLADETLGWTGAHQRELARLIFSLNLQAKQAARAGSGGEPDVATQDLMGQAAVVQGHVRHLLEALAATLAATPAA